MGGIILLLGLCAVMAIASFLAGALPLSMTLSQTQLRLISSIGVGVLVGTSMIVIIPEGIEASTAAASGHGHEHKVRSLVRRNPWATASDIASIGLAQRSTGKVDVEEVVVRRSITKRDDVVPAAAEDVNDAEPEPATDADVPQAEDEHGHDHSHDHSHEHSHADEQQGEEHHDDEGPQVPTFEIGFSMVLGFVLMFLIDRIPRHASDSLHPPSETQQFSLDNLSAAPDRPSTDEEQGFLGSLSPSPRQSRSLATTVGLVIHAAADGIAMGASSTAEDMKLGFIIFIAIMIHKAPAAFGLTSVLLKQGLSKRAARGHLIVFSLAAPVGALSTWLFIKLLGGGAMEGEHGQWWTGMLLLFSGGTFLYVAMHAMNEDANGHDHGAGANGFANGGGEGMARKQKGPQVQDTCATVVGMLLPLLTVFGGHHHH